MKSCIIFVMGVSGSGKTTVGKELAAATGFPFFDGDDFHPAENRAKMRSGIALTDADRAQWLSTMHQLAKAQEAAGAVIACSALREHYRQILGAGINVPVHWVFLQGDFKLIKQRIDARTGHYMPSSLLSSQFDTLEVPAYGLHIDISRTPAEIVSTILQELRESEC
jgi:carbohydrate kinase (thermoresistant glucokinase family)